MLKCSKCDTMKDASEFTKHNSTARGYQYWCRPCVAANKREWRRKPGSMEKAKESQRHSGRKSLYGLSKTDYMVLGTAQNWECGICHRDIDEFEGRDLDVDHDHKTKKVRGLLCGACNKGLGCFKDDLELLKSAIEWLEKGGS